MQVSANSGLRYDALLGRYAADSALFAAAQQEYAKHIRCVVKAIFVCDNGQILWGLSASRGVPTGKLSFPGGGVEFDGEHKDATLLHALRREVEEELVCLCGGDHIFWGYAKFLCHSTLPSGHPRAPRKVKSVWLFVVPCPYTRPIFCPRDGQLVEPQWGTPSRFLGALSASKTPPEARTFFEAAASALL